MISFIDMRTTSKLLPVRLLDRATRLTRLILIIVTPFVLVLAVLVLIGVGSLRLAGSTEMVRSLQFEPGEYHIDDNDGEPLDVAQATVFESERGDVIVGTTRVEISVGDDAIGIRAVATTLIIIWLVLAWVGVTSIAAMSTSIRAGEKFTAANAHRVRRLGGVVLAYPVLTFIGRTILRQMVESLNLPGPAVSVDVGVADWWAWILLGLLLVVIGELFAHGVALQELDETTI